MAAEWNEWLLPLEAVDDANETARRAAAASKILRRARLTETDFVDVVRTDLVLSMGRRDVLFFVHWRTLRAREEDWPSDADEYVFARNRMQNERVQSWLFPSFAMAAALCRTVWGIDIPVPPQN